MPASYTPTGHGYALDLAQQTLRVEHLAPGLLRIRRYPGAEPPETPLLRYGFCREDWPARPPEISVGAATVTSSDGLCQVTSGSDGRVEVRVGERVLLHELLGDCAFRARFALADETRFFGLGDQTRERLEHRGTRGVLWCRNVSGYVPVPFFWTNTGFGLLANTTRALRFDLGATSSDWFGFEADGGSLDYYVLYGPTPREIMARYTDLTGRPPLPPKWSLGLFFICRTQADAKELTDDCLNFRREGIPCDAIGLEPGWMARNYDFSLDKDWHPERFPVPTWARHGRHNFFPAIQRLGFKPGLWLCCDYDLSYEEERQAAARAVATGDAPAAAGGFEQDEHLTHARRMDTLTRPDEPWYRHLTDFVDQGAHWFKQDGANQVLDHPDRLYGNGMHDDEMHNLYPLLYSKQMYQGFKEHTGRRPFTFTVGGWAGLQRWTSTWTGDTGGEEGPLGACLNLSLTGHGMTTPDMEVTTKEGIHFGFLLPWSQLNSWTYWRHPWLLGEPLTGIFREYAQLRYRLLPYLYTCAWQAAQTGYPMLRAMPLEYPNEPATYGLLRQYLLGPSLLVGSFTDEVWLPEGEWVNHWTDEVHTGPGVCRPTCPADRGGPLLVRAGAVLVMGPPMDYVGQRPDDEWTIHVYAGGTSAIIVYEDDGLTFGHEDGAYRTTQITQTTGANQVTVTIEPAAGSFAGAATERETTIVVHAAGGAHTLACGRLATDEPHRLEVRW